MNKLEEAVKEGDIVKITATVLPENATEKRVKWSNEGLAGLVTFYEDEACTKAIPTENYETVATKLMTVYAKLNADPQITTGDTIYVKSAEDPWSANKEARCYLKRAAKASVTIAPAAVKGLKEIPHNARGPLAGEFQPLAACKVAKSESLIRPEPSPAKLPQISITRQVTFAFCSSQSTKIPSATEPLDYAVSLRACFKMPGDAVSSGFDCISRRFSAGLLGSSARKTLQWRVFSENGAEPPVERGGAPCRTGR